MNMDYTNKDTNKDKDIFSDTASVSGGGKSSRSSKSKSSKSGTKKKKSSSSTRKIIYFDNNATTMVCDYAKKASAKWISAYNVSTDSHIAQPAKKLLSDCINRILAQCGVNTASHTALFTSGATESNSFILRACVASYKKKLFEKNMAHTKPHIIISSTEHSSIIECARHLEENNDAEITRIAPTIYGNVLAEDVVEAIKPNTCLICVMYANNEIPVINNIDAILDKIGDIPLHCDCVQLFGKYKIDLGKKNIASLSASFHKFYGPKGVGVCILKNDFIHGYELRAEICGSQQHSLRGGTENIAGMAAGMAALEYAHQNRKKKNEHLFELRNYFLESLKEKFIFGDYESYFEIDAAEKKHEELELLSLGPPSTHTSFLLPNTVLLAVCKNRGVPFCNIDLKKFLDKKNCIISIGAACLTKSADSSHVLVAIGAPSVIKRGVIRVSFCDDNTKKEIDVFTKYLVEGIKAQCDDIEIARPSSKKTDDEDKNIDDEDINDKPKKSRSKKR
jgi:cysteine desulfurase